MRTKCLFFWFRVYLLYWPRVCSLIKLTEDWRQVTMNLRSFREEKVRTKTRTAYVILREVGLVFRQGIFDPLPMCRWDGKNVEEHSVWYIFIFQNCVVLYFGWFWFWIDLTRFDFILFKILRKDVKGGYGRSFEGRRCPGRSHVTGRPWLGELLILVLVEKKKTLCVCVFFCQLLT